MIHEEADVAQIPCHVLYQGSDVLLLRAAARSLDSASVPWPDPADSEELRTWLVKAWEDPVLREAVACASPSLALRADRIAAGQGVPARQVRSAAVALARYQLRAAGRPTPFGLFAGVAGARFGGSALARFGEAHRAAARCDAAWLLSVIERCEACAPLAGRLSVVFSSLAVGGFPGPGGVRRGCRLRARCQDPLVDSAQFGARLDAELVDEDPACPLVGVQRLGPPADGRQREHELGMEPFLQRVAGRHVQQMRC
jgi:hypothetical protein